jgi:hypothetical protein
MATVTKDFRIKSGLVVEGTNATVNGSDILTEDSIANGVQNNITVTYNANSKTLDFSVDSLAIDTAGPLTYANNVLDVVTGDGLTVTDNALVVSLAQGSGLEFLQGTLSTNTDNSTIAINNSNELAVQYGTGLTVESPFGLVLDNEHVTDLIANTVTGGTQNGISVTYNDNTNVLSFDVNDPTITISGDVDGSATMTNLGNTTISVTLDTVNANVGTYGSSTAIPVVTVNAKGLVTAVGEASISTTLNVAGDSGNTSVSLGTDTLTFSGGEGIDVTVANNDTVTIAAAEDATTSNKGVASFNTNNFTVTDGAVSSKSITLGSSTLELGGNTSSLAGLTQLTVDNIEINGNEISSTDTNGNISLNPNGNGVVDVNSSRITNLAAPDASTDAATKAYVDSVAEGLHIHASAKAATVANINIATDLEAGDVLDNVTLVAGDRVLVKNQNTASENGIYVVQASGAATRALDFDSPAEVDGGDFIFVTGGAINGDTGWVQTSDTVATIGTDPIYFTQFSGAGTYTAGYGLNLDGTEFEIDDNVVVTHTDLDGFLNSTEGEEGTTILYVQDYVSNAIAIGDATATPTYLALDVNSLALNVAAEVNAASANVAVTAYDFPAADYRSAKFLVRVAYGSHTEVSEVLLTLDSSNNIAITEYAVVSTNGSASTITADINSGDVRLRVTPTNASSTVTVYGTLLA